MTIEERAHLLYACEIDLITRQGVLKALLHPDTGDALFVNTFVVTYDPRNDAKTDKPIGYKPMLLWPAQEEAIKKIGYAMDKGRDLGEEKSRDWGMTWLDLACIFKRFLFIDGFSALIGAMTEGLVDDQKSPASLFWKLNCIWENLPGWMLPKGYDPRVHRSWGNWVNPVTGATITGRAPTARFPVGDRKSVVYFDDWAQWEHGLSAWNNAAATTDCRIASWTVNRDDPLNHAYELAKGKGSFKGVKVDILKSHWSDDPRKQVLAIDPKTKKEYNAWKREMVGDKALAIPGRISMEQFLRDYEMVYEMAAKGRIYAEQLPYTRLGRFPYDKRFSTFTLWDYGRKDFCAIIFLQWDYEEYRLRVIDVIQRTGQGIGYYIPLITGRQSDTEVLEFEDQYTPEDWEQIRRRESWQRYNKQGGRRTVPYADHFGDPAGKAKSISHNKSAADVLAEAGIYVTVRDDNSGKSYMGRIEATRFLLPYMDIDQERCALLIEALQNYKWAETETSKPEHDEHSHLCASLEYGSVNLIDFVKDCFEKRKEAIAIANAGRSPAEFGPPGFSIPPNQVNRIERGNKSSYTEANSITGY